MDLVSSDVWYDKGVAATAQRTENGELHAIFGADPSIRISLDQSAFASYASLMEAFQEASYDYGYIDDGTVPELQGENGEWVAVSDPSAPLSYGTYRIKYVVRNGSAVREGYILSQYLTPGGE